jgi:peptidoglycan/xylan/chitin deacetylase (PgdA/CDA1 family)
MTTIIEGMTPGEFLTAINANFSYLTYDEAVITNILLADGIDKIKTNFDNLFAKKINTTTITDIVAGMSSANHLSKINENFINIDYSQKVKVDRPILTIRFDDGWKSIYDGWFPVTEDLGINAVMPVLSSHIGDSYLGIDFMSWANALTLETAGWEIIGHGTTYISTYDTETEAQVIADMLACKAAIKANGLSCEGFAGHVESGDYPGMNLINKKLFKYGQNDLYPDGESYPINPVNMDINFLKLVAIDGNANHQARNYNITNAIGKANVKAALDITATQDRWMIIVLHGYVAEQEAPFREIVAYANTIGLTIATSKEVYENYLIPQ